MKKEPLRYIKSFGIKIYIKQFSILVLNKLNIFNTIKNKIKISKNKDIINYLIKKYHYVIDEYKDISIKSNNYSNNIWIFWYQGIDTAPEIVKKSINSIKKYCKSKNVIIITKNNIEKYYKIPDHIKEKINSKQITLTHLSDILRMNLLKKYGGFWIDATIYLTDNPFNNENFTTIKFHNTDKTSISNGMWCSFFIGGKNQLFYNFMVDFFNEYWKKEQLLIDYFLIDYVINIAYNNLQTIKDKFDNIPYNNEQIHTLQSLLNKEFHLKEYCELNKNNSVHKLSYKEIINVNDVNNYYNKIDDFLFK